MLLCFPSFVSSQVFSNHQASAPRWQQETSAWKSSSNGAVGVAGHSWSWKGTTTKDLAGTLKFWKEIALCFIHKWQRPAGDSWHNGQNVRNEQSKGVSFIMVSQTSVLKVFLVNISRNISCLQEISFYQPPAIWLFPVLGSGKSSFPAHISPVWCLCELRAIRQELASVTSWQCLHKWTCLNQMPSQGSFEKPHLNALPSISTLQTADVIHSLNVLFMLWCIQVIFLEIPVVIIRSIGVVHIFGHGKRHNFLGSFTLIPEGCRHSRGLLLGVTFYHTRDNIMLLVNSLLLCFR